MTRNALVCVLLAGVWLQACDRAPRLARTQPTPLPPAGDTVTLFLPVGDELPPDDPDVQRRGLVARVPGIGLGIFGYGQVLRMPLFATPSLTVLTQLYHIERPSDDTVRAVGIRLCEGSPGCLPGHVYFSASTERISITMRLPEVGDVTVEPHQGERLRATQYKPILSIACPSSTGLPNPFDWFPRATPLETSRLDVGLRYTRKALCGDVPDTICGEAELKKLKDDVTKWMMEASVALSCSRVNARVNVVALTPIDYVESTTLEQDLKTLNDPRKTAGGDVLAFRHTQKADAVLVLVGGATDFYGLAKVFPAWRVKSFADLATGVAIRSKAFVNRVLLHELGHILGGGHQRGKGRGRSWYSHGKTIEDGPNLKLTIMATGKGTRLNEFSSPSLFYQGTTPTGSWHQNNVRTFNRTRRRVENFQTGALTPTPTAISCQPGISAPVKSGQGGNER